MLVKFISLQKVFSLTFHDRASNSNSVRDASYFSSVFDFSKCLHEMLAKKIMFCYGVSNVQRSQPASSPAQAFVKDSTNSIPVAATCLLIHKTEDEVLLPLMESQTGGLDSRRSWRIRWKSRSWDCLLQLSLHVREPPAKNCSDQEKGNQSLQSSQVIWPRPN